MCAFARKKSFLIEDILKTGPAGHLPTPPPAPPPPPLPPPPVCPLPLRVWPAPSQLPLVVAPVSCALQQSISSQQHSGTLPHHGAALSGPTARPPHPAPPPQLSMAQHMAQHGPPLHPHPPHYALMRHVCALDAHTTGVWASGRRAGGQVRFSAAQSGALERRFAAARYLSAEQRRRLAADLRLSDRQVKTWFQNRRAKWRRGDPRPTSATPSAT